VMNRLLFSKSKPKMKIKENKRAKTMMKKIPAIRKLSGMSILSMSRFWHEGMASTRIIKCNKWTE
jgi:hypothetical protein